MDSGHWHPGIFYKIWDKLYLNLKKPGEWSQTNVIPPLDSSPRCGREFGDKGGRAGKAIGTFVPARERGTAAA